LVGFLHRVLTGEWGIFHGGASAHAHKRSFAGKTMQKGGNNKDKYQADKASCTWSTTSFTVGSVSAGTFNSFNFVESRLDTDEKLTRITCWLESSLTNRAMGKIVEIGSSPYSPAL